MHIKFALKLPQNRHFRTHLPWAYAKKQGIFALKIPAKHHRVSLFKAPKKALFTQQKAFFKQLVIAI